MLRVLTGPARSRLHNWTAHFEHLIRSSQAETNERLDRITERLHLLDRLDRLDRLEPLEERLSRTAREVELGQERLADQYSFLAARLTELTEELAAARAELERLSAPS